MNYYDATAIDDRERRSVPGAVKPAIEKMLDGRGLPRESSPEDRANTWVELAAIQRLHAMIGQPAIDAIRALDAGDDPVTVLLRYREALLSPKLAQALRLARERGAVTSADLREQEPAILPSTAINRLRELQRLGLLEQVEVELVSGGGRRFVYRAWDAPRLVSAGLQERLAMLGPGSNLGALTPPVSGDDVWLLFVGDDTAGGMFGHFRSDVLQGDEGQSTGVLVICDWLDQDELAQARSLIGAQFSVIKVYSGAGIDATVVGEIPLGRLLDVEDNFLYARIGDPLGAIRMTFGMPEEDGLSVNVDR